MPLVVLPATNDRISVNLEFATISMLVVFYASLYYKSTW
jgi:hypothetical protein